MNNKFIPLHFTDSTFFSCSYFTILIRFRFFFLDHSRYSIQDSISKYDYSLKITNATISQSGTFSCQNPPSSRIQKVKVDVIAEPKSIILTARNVFQDFENLPASTISVVKDETNALECRVEKARPKANIFWTKNGNRIVDRDETIESGEDESVSGLFWSKSVLNLLPLDLEENGDYKCVIEHDSFDANLEKNVNLNIMVKPEASLVANPRIVKENENIEFTCSSKNAVPPAHQFSLIINSEIYETNDNGVFVYENSKRDLNQAQISCISENHAGRSIPSEIENSKDLIIAYGPEMSHTSSSLKSVSENSELIIACPVKSAPQPRISWLKKDENGDWTKIENDKNLSEDNLVYQVNSEFQDSGVYKCQAENTFLGEKLESGITEVKIQGKPQFFSEKSEWEYEISNPVIMIPFFGSPVVDDVKISWKNLSNSPITLDFQKKVQKIRGGQIELIQLDIENYRNEFESLGIELELENPEFLEFVETIGVIKFSFSKFTSIPGRIDLLVSNEFGMTNLSFRPVGGDTVGRIAAIIGGCIAGGILILAAIVAGVYYQRRQTKNRTYQPGNIVRAQSDSTTPIMNNGSSIVNSVKIPQNYAASLSSSQRDDGYITEQSHHTSYNENNTENSNLLKNNNDSASDSIDVSKVQTESGSSMLKVLPKIVGSVHSSGVKSDSKSIESSSNPETADLPLPPPELSNSSVVNDGTYNPDHFRSVYTSHFSGSSGTGRTNSGGSEKKSTSISGSSKTSQEFPKMSGRAGLPVPYKTMNTRRKTKSGSHIKEKPRSLTQV